MLDPELSWIDFDSRIQWLAESERVPLLERVKFAAIVATNLDEYFMVRVADLVRDGRAPRQALHRSAALASRHAAGWRDELAPALARAGIRIVGWDDLTDAQRAGLAGRLGSATAPVLRDGHRSHHPDAPTLHLAVRLPDRIDIVDVPATAARFVSVPGGDGTTLLPLEELAAAGQTADHHAFRVTRASGGTAAVRIEVGERMPDDLVDRLISDLGTPSTVVHRLPEPLGLGDLWELHDLDRPDLKDEQLCLPPLTRAHEAGDILGRVRRGEVLVHHPYESFATSVQALIERAADDPRVVAIRQTLYRTTADPIVNALVRAAEAGKRVVVVVELRARFEEEANRAWAHMLERAGCEVIHGVPGLKTHAKLVLVDRHEGGAIRRYVHVGTGNYNATTARTYEDIGLLSADPELANAIGEVFDLLGGTGSHAGSERLMVAPFDLRPRLLARIAAETDAARAGTPARVAIKCNALTDPELVEALYAASSAGVEVDLVVRGVCTLRPGVPGLSDRIRVRSIVGRSLEHSRILRFGCGPDAETWIGSADLMERNLDRRVEVLVRLDDPAHRQRLDRVMALAMADSGSAWTLGADGAWSPPADPATGLALQGRLADDAVLGQAAVAGSGERRLSSMVDDARRLLAPRQSRLPEPG